MAFDLPSKICMLNKRQILGFLLILIFGSMVISYWILSLDISMIFKQTGMILSVIVSLIAIFSKTSQERRPTKTGWVLISFAFLSLVFMAFGEILTYLHQRQVEEIKGKDRQYLMMLDFPIDNIILDIHLDTLNLKQWPSFGIQYHFETQSYHPRYLNKGPAIKSGSIEYNRKKRKQGWDHISSCELVDSIYTCDTLIQVKFIYFQMCFYDQWHDAIPGPKTIRDLADIRIALSTNGNICDSIKTESPLNCCPVTKIDIIAESNFFKQKLVSLEGVAIRSQFWQGYIYLPELWIKEDTNIAALQIKGHASAFFSLDPNLMRNYLDKLPNQ